MHRLHMHSAFSSALRARQKQDFPVAESPSALQLKIDSPPSGMSWLGRAGENFVCADAADLMLPFCVCALTCYLDFFPSSSLLSYAILCFLQCFYLPHGAICVLRLNTVFLFFLSLCWAVMRLMYDKTLYAFSLSFLLSCSPLLFFRPHVSACFLIHSTHIFPLLHIT